MPQNQKCRLYFSATQHHALLSIAVLTHSCAQKEVSPLMDVLWMSRRRRPTNALGEQTNKYDLNRQSAPSI